MSALLAMALAAGGSCAAEPLLYTPQVDMVMVVSCEAGGMHADSCQINCHRIFNFYASFCSVTCRSGYFACCNCNTGCQCVQDHEEIGLPSDDPILR